MCFTTCVSLASSPSTASPILGPLKHTLDDMWKMIVDTNAKIIVMVTNLIENGKVTSVKKNLYFSLLPILTLVLSSQIIQTRPISSPILHRYLHRYSTHTSTGAILILHWYPTYIWQSSYLHHTSPNFTWSCLKLNEPFLEYKMCMNNVQFISNSRWASVALLFPNCSPPIWFPEQVRLLLAKPRGQQTAV